ncbi:glycoside hydrolase family 99-like domain-containing protein [Asticcacaulis sp. EMRT-3]|uniref:glycoside hydrolase family 99-like domain-containing protein n=1 Tax=Asticcacaulis sp. EMRT-3 TaxID=3040349 RepID=UPI0024AF85A9|nr:glycoside hydrolase family 99-like domain-containing protein [Asticcacaulis sp. EMRT-3]MDI7776347.1 glycoside hydrolase family 99-like domain-containing protein [Asticcacaulis sp. EMRT-3]
MRILLVSHCNFLGNSAIHVFSLARALGSLGHDIVVLIPEGLETIERHHKPDFPVRLYADALAGDLPFAEPGPVDLIHAWSPREHVRKAVEALADIHACPYLLHMEDNEEQILSNELNGLTYDEIRRLPGPYLDAVTGDHRSHPVHYRRFADKAAGYTCLIEPLLEFKPAHVPGMVFWPGFDPEFEHLPADTAASRELYKIDTDEIIIFYGGNVHASIAHDIRNLYLATAYLRQCGLKIRLLRTGWNYADLNLPDSDLVREASIELGFVDRSLMPGLLALADILVQPGRADAFNDYRFPSKLPEYLVSARPVILPDSNIGKVLTDGEQVLKLYDGTLAELIEKIRLIARAPELASTLGKAGRRFALEALNWMTAAKALDAFYRRLVPAETPHIRKPQSDEPLSDVAANAGSEPVRAIAFYLPQFHPTPENDQWWGKGFTEWSNVARARPQMFNHRHPRLPTDLGYYDLRVPDVLHEQARLAAEYGIGGFCFYVYWFEGRRVLEKPVNIWLDKGPDFPFCICWANENWTRRWDGSDTEILIPQAYMPGFEERFIIDMLPMLKDPRYIRVGAAPLLPIYKVSDFPDARASAQAFREAARKHGLPDLHLVAMQSFGHGDPRPYGFDAAIEFTPPHKDRLLIDPERMGGVDPSFAGQVEDYVGVAARSINAKPTDYVRYRGCTPMWDNTARRGERGHVLVNDSPKAYAAWLRFLTHEAMLRRQQVEPMIFINAWNEWAEGAYLEPDEHHGRTYLELTRLALLHGFLDFAQGPNPERDRIFAELTSRLPK